jgi:hypothetical protein
MPHRNIIDVHPAGDQSGCVERVGDALLGGHGGGGDGLDLVAAAAVYGFYNGGGDGASERGQALRAFGRVGVQPGAGFGEGGVDGLNDGWVGLGEWRADHVEAVVVAVAGAVGEAADGNAAFLNGEVWVPDGPGIEVTAGEGGGAVGGFEVGEVDIGGGEVGVL